MKRLLTLAAVALGAAASGSAVLADEPPPSWPPGKAQVFIWADTVTAAKSTYGYVPAAVGKQENFFPRTAGVMFRMYAVDLKTKKVLTDKNVRFAYVAIPNQPNLKLTFGKQGSAANAPLLWTGTWSIPPGFALGVVEFRIFVRTKTNRYGSFQQAPVSASQLTVLPAP